MSWSCATGPASSGIADADPPGGTGKAIIKLPMPGHYRLRHGREEKSGRCRRATTRGEFGSDNYRITKEARRLAPSSLRPALLPYFPRGRLQSRRGGAGETPLLTEEGSPQSDKTRGQFLTLHSIINRLSVTSTGRVSIARCMWEIRDTDTPHRLATSDSGRFAARLSK